MNELLFIGIVNFSILMTVLTVADDEIAWPVMAFVSWIVCAVAVTDLERPYVYVASSVPTEGAVHYSGGVFMQFFFLGIAAIFIAIFVNRVLEVWRESVERKRRKAMGE